MDEDADTACPNLGMPTREATGQWHQQTTGAGVGSMVLHWCMGTKAGATGRSMGRGGPWMDKSVATGRVHEAKPWLTNVVQARMWPECMGTAGKQGMGDTGHRCEGGDR